MQVILPLKKFAILIAQEYSKFNIPDKSASLAYRALFALAPILILVTSVASLSAFGSLTVEGLEEFFVRYFGSQSESFVRSVIGVTDSSMGLVTAIVGFLLVAYGAVGFFLTMQRSFFHIFSTTKLDKSPVKNILYTYFYSFGYLVVFLFFIITLFVARFLLVSGVEFLEGIFFYSMSAVTVRALTAVLMLLLLTAFLGISYRFFSRYKIKWIDALAGGLTASVLILLLNNFLGLYFSFSSVLSLYGTSAFLVAILLWVYFFSMILFSGALVARNISKV